MGLFKKFYTARKNPPPHLKQEYRGPNGTRFEFRNYKREDWDAEEDEIVEIENGEEE